MYLLMLFFIASTKTLVDIPALHTNKIFLLRSVPINNFMINNYVYHVDVKLFI